MTTEYLKTLYTEFSNKVRSINKYLEKVKSETGDLNQSVFEWAGKLHDKYDALETFQQSRPHLPPVGDFAIENREQPQTMTDDGSLKKIEREIVDCSEQINHQFEKTQRDVQFLVQTLQDLQDVVNQIYDKYESLYDAM